MPTGHLGDLTTAALHYLHLSLAPSSLATYRSGWSSYSNFCSSHRFPTLPLSEATLLLFCTSLASRNVTHGTIKVYLYALTYFSRLSGHAFSVDLFPRLQFLLRGVRRSQGNTLTRPLRSPITLTHLRSLHTFIFRHFADQSIRSLRARTVLCSGRQSLPHFFGLLRASEFTAPSSSSFLPSTLLYHHVSFSFSPNVAHLFLPSSKTDQFASGADIKLFRQSPPVCPFSATLAFHTVHPFRTGPFFRFCSGDYLTRSAFVALLRSVFPSQSSLNSHSFRIGGASALAAAGIPDFEIRILGRWSSDSFLRYIRLRPSSLRDHQSRMRHAPSL